MRKIIIVLLLWSCSTFANGTRGGGNSVGNDLLDFYENKDTHPFNVLESPAYIREIRPILEFHSKDYPGMLSEIEERINKGLHWYLEAKPLSDVLCKGRTEHLRAQGKILSCMMHREEVRIDGAKWEKLGISDQAMVLLFNIMAVRQKPDSDSEDLTEFLKKFFSRTMNSVEFRNYIGWFLGVNHFYSQKEYNDHISVATTVAKPTLSEFCKRQDKNNLAMFINNGLLGENALYSLDSESRYRFYYLGYTNAPVGEALYLHSEHIRRSPIYNASEITDEELWYFTDVFLKDERLSIFGLNCKK